jgi:homoserine dehydrogenase
MEVRLALTGFGNVGQGVAHLLVERPEVYRDRYGVDLVLTGVADRGGSAVNPSGLDLAALFEAKRSQGTVAAAPGGHAGLAGEAFLDLAAAQVLLEASSTNFENAEPGWSYVLAALGRNMDVVLASKGALVLHFQELMEQARVRDLRVLFSATIGAPLPVIELAERVLIGNDILGFEGIVNATSNQILEAMSNGATYEEGVKQAQELGIAETDPTLDVDGWDAAAKAAIIADAVLGAALRLEDVQRHGMRDVTREELEQARQQNQRVKLVARVMRRDGGFEATVGPERRDRSDSIGRLEGGQMSITYFTHPLGTVNTTIEGGAGGLQTALTMLRDVVNLARDRGWASPSPR